MERARLRALTHFSCIIISNVRLMVEMERARLRALTHVFPYLLPNLSAKASSLARATAFREDQSFLRRVPDTPLFCSLFRTVHADTLETHVSPSSMVYIVKKLEPHLKYWIPRGRRHSSDSAKVNIAGNFSTTGPAN